MFLTGTYARNRFEFAIRPTQVSNQTTFEQKTSFLLPATSPYYPHDFARTFGIDGTPLNVYWSAVELGPRTIAPITEQWNVVAGIRGVALGWTYDGAFNYSRSDVDQRSTDGYVRESALMPILNSGVVNPFGPNTQAVVDLMSTAKFNGTLRSGTGSTTSLDFIASADVFALPSGPLSVAIGMSARREEVTQTSVPALESGDILNLNTSSSLVGCARHRGAVRRGKHSSRQHARGQCRRQVRSLQRFRRHDQSAGVAALATGPDTAAACVRRAPDSSRPP